MFFTVVSPKYQATMGMETRDLLKPGMRMKGSVENGRIILEPIGDALSSYGVFKKYAKGRPVTIEEETEAAERGMAEEAMESMRNE